jgi:very-short-patch-repair endonuclease
VAHDLRLLLGEDGVRHTSELTHLVDRHTVTRWVAAGRLLRPYPGVLVLPSLASEWRTRALAAVLGTGGVLSHSSALAVWRRAPREGLIHVSVRAGRRAVLRPSLSVHRVQALEDVRLGDLPVTPLPRALVDTWGHAHSAVGTARAVELARAAVIGALRDRQAHILDVRGALESRRTLPGRGSLEQLLHLVERGCESELEIWGVREVLAGPGMPVFVQQHRVVLPGGSARLDAALPGLKVAVEMDGAAFHGSPEDRERDTRRDVALATLGWVVLRFSYRRLIREPDACRREILAVCRARAASLR